MVPFRRHTGVLRDSVARAISKIRVIADKLCGMANLPETESSMNPLSFEDNNTLINGLKSLFDSSDYDEQVRILTISPPSWGRVKIENFFGCNQWQTRKAMEMRDSFGILAKPTNFSGNHPIDPLLAEEIRAFFQDDAISRQTSNKKEVIHVEKQPIPIRYMSMTVGQAYALFLEKIQENHHLNFISKTIFYSLRPKWVKILTPHDVCACIYHENFDFLIQVRSSSRNIRHRLFSSRHGINWV